MSAYLSVAGTIILDLTKVSRPVQAARDSPKILLLLSTGSVSTA
ncbi:hypothetical protein FOPG_18152 [Fusarium oxysporum f. sp. conglutinans race 2 54008]|uniref:Uncharacterized protein n=1 Tax=Fusarium oxysporum f. sp. conglutinans race 2 54008 TaxID=1089457 RepID=X0H0K0_FUSOX|nr:hypothetical protein FOPG_18152 [Fusarium oxysporum f. sp. conglutinans race 2 54008]